MTIVSGEFLSGSPFRPISTTTVIPPIGEFVAREKYRVDLSKEAEVRIADVMSAFDELLVKVEEALPQSVVEGRLLSDWITSATLAQEVGGRGIVTLGQLWWMLRRQRSGDYGSLCAYDHCNLFLVVLNDEVLYEVTAQWSKEQLGWVLGATPFDPRSLWTRWNWVFRRTA